MNVKVFAYRRPAFLRLAIPTDKMELEIQDWLAKRIDVFHHAAASSFRQARLRNPRINPLIIEPAGLPT